MPDVAKQRWRPVRAEDAETFVRETLLSPSRQLPVVAITTSASTGRPWIDPVALAADLDDRAEVVLIETGEATWALSATLPRRLDVFGGAVRIWWTRITRESDPYDHLLVLIYGPAEAVVARQRIIAAIVEGDEAAGHWGGWRPAAARPRSVQSPPAAPPARQPETRPERPGGTITRRAGEIDPWRRISEEYRVGEIVRARVFRIDPHYVLVELLPGAGVIVPLAEVDYTWVQHPADVLTVGEIVNVRLLDLDPPARRGLASIKQALHESPREGIALRPGEPPFLEGTDAEVRGAGLQHELRRDRETAREMREELDATLDDRQRLAQHNEQLKEQLVSARKDLRSAEDRARSLEQQIAGEFDPLASETAFLAAVRVEYARRFDEADRLRYPLMRMRVGRAFLACLRELEGIEPAKVVGVCAMVASGRAHEIPGRSVHELKAGEGGRPIVRLSDGARAWRCSLQENTPSARRLHWWSIPGAEGATVEFASVAVHDDFAIPA